MSRARVSLLVATGLVTLAACSDSPTIAGPNASDARPSFAVAGSDVPIREIMETRPRALEHADRMASGASSGSTGIYYHGGPLLTSVTNVVAIYWASSPIYAGGPIPPSTGSGAQDRSLIGFFLRHLGGSSYFNINTTYYNGAGTHVANKVNYTAYWARAANAPAARQSVSDAQMIAMLQWGFANGRIAWDPNTLYAIFTAGTANLGGGFGTQYCAYHTSGTVTINGGSKPVLYAAMPYDYAYPSACTNGTKSPNNDPGADAEVNTLAHETEETTTDYFGNAWYDYWGYENADKCAWNFGATKTASNGGVYNMTLGNSTDGYRNFLVQQNWINAGSGGCRIAY